MTSTVDIAGTGTGERGRPVTADDRERLSWRQELVTMALGTWLMVGLFVDGWAHANLTELETFFTPWHALFYSGFGATVAWIGWCVMRAQERGRRGLAAVPLGYGLALVGGVAFAAGGAGDLVWHEVWGIEQGIEALFSPTHLLLFAGIALILSAPLRAAWTADPADAAPGYRAFLPVLLSASLTTLLVSFMFMFFSAFFGSPLTAGSPQAGGAGGLGYDALTSGLAGVFATNLIVLAPVLLLLRRWRLPFGAVTTTFTMVALLGSALGEFRDLPLVPAATVAGLGADLLIRRLRPSPAQPRAYWTLAGVVPMVLWSAWFVAMALDGGVGISLELWSGTVLWSGLLGCALALLMVPPAAPRGAVVAVAPRDGPEAPPSPG